MISASIQNGDYYPAQMVRIDIPRANLQDAQRAGAQAGESFMSIRIFMTTTT